MSYRRRLPRVAMASMRSKAGKQHAHELDKSEMLKHAARKLMSHSSGDGSGSGSGSGPEAPYLASIQYEGKHVCSGVLVHETVVLTTASCMKDAGPGAVVFVQGEGDFMAHEVASMHVHPSAMFDKHNDVAVLELKEPCAAQPAKLYDGGDLGISDCKRMMLTYSSWNLEESDAAASGSPGPVRRRLLDDSGSPGSGATSPGDGRWLLVMWLPTFDLGMIAMCRDKAMQLMDDSCLPPCGAGGQGLSLSRASTFAAFVALPLAHGAQCGCLPFLVSVVGLLTQCTGCGAGVTVSDARLVDYKDCMEQYKVCGAWLSFCHQFQLRVGCGLTVARSSCAHARCNTQQLRQHSAS